MFLISLDKDIGVELLSYIYNKLPTSFSTDYTLLHLKNTIYEF